MWSIIIFFGRNKVFHSLWKNICRHAIMYFLHSGVSPARVSQCDTITYMYCMRHTVYKDIRIRNPRTDRNRTQKSLEIRNRTRTTKESQFEILKPRAIFDRPFIWSDLIWDIQFNFFTFRSRKTFEVRMSVLVVDYTVDRLFIKS